jgi:hypothetical protein
LFFFEKKNQKTFAYWISLYSERTRLNQTSNMVNHEDTQRTKDATKLLPHGVRRRA